MVLLGSLGIDVSLFIAQIINFIILLWLLHRFVYRPLIAKIRAEDTQLSGANKKTAKAVADEELARKKGELEIAKARQKAKRIIADAKKMAETIAAQTENDLLRQEKAKLTKRS